MGHFAQISTILRDSECMDDASTCTAANQATFSTGTSSSLIVKGRSIRDIQALLSYAHTHRLKVYVVSQGKNWGFGSKVPPIDVEILLDLSGMYAISHYDPEFGTLRVEPGVTFAQLAEFLKSEGNHHFLSVTGGDPQSSVLGNLLERGDGVGPYCDRWEFACAAQVVLPDGSLIDLGVGEGADASPLRDLMKEGAGPGFHGLFLQSNLGIVVGITLWLVKVPADFRVFQFGLAAGHSIAPVLDHLKSLYARRILSAPVAIWNDYKQIVNAIQYPWAAQPKPPLLRSTITTFSNDYNRWLGFGAVYVDHVGIAKLVTRELFAGLVGKIKDKGPLSVISTAKMRRFRKEEHELAGTPMSRISILEKWDTHPLLGQTSDRNTRSLSWRKRSVPPGGMNPDRDGCGLLWNAFALPFNGITIEAALGELDTLVLAHGFEPVISMLISNDRNVRIFLQLIFDRDVPGEDQKALTCHQAVFDLCESKGWVHTRLDILNMHRLAPGISALQARIKQALDPDSLLSPGRYESKER